MSPSNFAREKQAMIGAAEAASEVLRNWFEKVAASEEGRDALLGAQVKSEHYKDSVYLDGQSYEDVFTHADIESEATILPILKQCRDISIRSEESHPDETDLPNGTQRWLVDPLDGTSLFKKGKPGFSITLALQTKKEGVWHTDVGVVAMPMEHRMFIADGTGAELKDAEGLHALPSQAEDVPVPESRKDALKDKAVEVVVYSKSNMAVMDMRKPFLDALREHGAKPQATFSTAMVMAGMAQKPSVDATVLMSHGLEFAWDVDAGIHIAEKAGLTVKRTSIDGEPCVILARGMPLATALEQTLREEYRRQREPQAGVLAK